VSQVLQVIILVTYFISDSFSVTIIDCEYYCFCAVWKHLLLQLRLASTVLLQAISWHGFAVQATD